MRNNHGFLVICLGFWLSSCAHSTLAPAPEPQKTEPQVVETQNQPEPQQASVAAPSPAPASEMAKPAPVNRRWKMVKGRLNGAWPAAKVLQKVKNPKTPGFTTDTCWDFGTFSVVETKSTDEVGSAEVVLRQDGQGLCKVEFKGKTTALRITEGHFAGVAGPVLVIEGDDSSEGLLEFQLFDVETGKELFKSYHHPAQDFALHQQGEKVSLEYFAKVKASCELATGDKECWARILKDNKVKRPTPMPDCKAAFQVAKVSEFEPALVTVRARIADVRRPAVELLGGGLATCAPAP